MSRQENWRGEIEAWLSKLTSDGIPNDSELIHRREEELKHAQDVRLMYEQKLRTADVLYRELKSCKMQLDAKELELQRCVCMHVRTCVCMCANMLHKC